MHRGLSQHRTLSTNSASTVHLLESAAAAVPKCQTMMAPGQSTALSNANHFCTTCTSVLSTAHICTAQQSISVARGHQAEPPQQKKKIVVWRDGWDVISTAVPMRRRNLLIVPSMSGDLRQNPSSHFPCGWPGQPQHPKYIVCSTVYCEHWSLPVHARSMSFPGWNGDPT